MLKRVAMSIGIFIVSWFICFSLFTFGDISIALLIGIFSAQIAILYHLILIADGLEKKKDDKQRSARKKGTRR